MTQNQIRQISYGKRVTGIMYRRRENVHLCRKRQPVERGRVWHRSPHPFYLRFFPCSDSRCRKWPRSIKLPLTALLPISPANQTSAGLPVSRANGKIPDLFSGWYSVKIKITGTGNQYHIKLSGFELII